jgi:quinoprotein glucose dehydrogenase
MRRVLALTLILPVATLFAVPPDQTKKSDDTQTPQTAASRAQIAGGLRATPWAVEPMFQNPCAFTFDAHGKCYVVEANRYKDGVPDTRGHMYWLDEDIGSRSVADRVAMYKKHKFPAFPNFDDRVQVMWDSSSKGAADKYETFSKGYTRPDDGIGSGLLARNGQVYFTCIPDLYVLRDTNGDGKADEKKSLATGFGIRCQFIGHDLHGLVLGPDGKLYFSIGDRGLNVTTIDGKKLVNYDSGAVLRCDFDGTNMAIVHTGLRNPQELAFDDFGNLFTYENNCDSGDSARWVQIVEGGDSGWRCGFQYGTLMHTTAVPQGNRGPWNTEKLWHLQHPEQPAYIVPPLAHFGNGPAGLTHYPGVGLDAKYQNHFFACDFTANPTNSIIWSLAVKPKGASFEVVDRKPFVQQVVPTDCEFGPDGAFYWSDWLGGWEKPNKGRIFRVADPEAMKNPAIAESQKLLATGFTKTSVDELVKLLGHVHKKVRYEAQFELAARAKTELKTIAFKLASLTMSSKAERLQRLHAIWCLGMIEGGGKNSSLLLQSAKTIFKDSDVELRAATAKTLGLYPSAWNALRTALSTENDLRVKANLLISLGGMKPENSADVVGRGGASAAGLRARVLPALEQLKANNDADVYLRHAAVQSLVTATGDKPCDLVAVLRADQSLNASPAVRLGVVLALRRMQCRMLGEFVTDSEPRIAAEAARAIHDENLMEPMAELAKLSEKPGVPDAIAFRALSANFKLSAREHCERVANFAARTNEADHLRIAAMKLLEDWAKPSKRDAITGCAQVLPDRDPILVVNAVKPILAKLFAGSDGARHQAVSLVSKLKIKEVGTLLASIVNDSTQTVSTRVDSLFALESLKAAELNAVAESVMKSSDAKLRAAARVVRAKADTMTAELELPKLVKDETVSIIEKQMAFEVMGTMKESKAIDESLAEWLDAMIADKVLAELKLDILDAATARTTTRELKLHAPLRDKLAAYDKAVRAKAGDHTAKRYVESLAGGDATKGRDIFLNNAAVYCQRCHKLDNQGGEVGPVLNGIATTKTREYLLESIVMPNHAIAQGYQSVILETLDGKQVTGVLKSEDAKAYTLVNVDNKTLVVRKADVDGKPRPDKSAMPDDLYKKLSKRELRDVIEFLASLK